jgi:predicted dinucleotide-binding enzyme
MINTARLTMLRMRIDAELTQGLQLYVLTPLGSAHFSPFNQRLHGWPQCIAHLSELILDLWRYLGEHCTQHNAILFQLFKLLDKHLLIDTLNEPFQVRKTQCGLGGEKLAENDDFPLSFQDTQGLGCGASPFHALFGITAIPFTFCLHNFVCYLLFCRYFQLSHKPPKLTAQRAIISEYMMKIAIIGTGNIGGTIARKLRAAGHDVRAANAGGVATVQPFADEIGATAADVRSVVHGVEVIILAIPLAAISGLPAQLFNAVHVDVTVIDTSNYYPDMRDPRIADIDAGMTESVWVSRQIGRPVVKAFNNALAYTLKELGQPAGTPGRLAIAVAGDHAQGKQTAMALVEQCGFDPVDAGSLEESWRQQPSTPAYCCDYDAETMRRELAAAVKGEATRKRDQLPALFAELGTAPTHEAIVAMNRRVNSGIAP